MVVFLTRGGSLRVAGGGISNTIDIYDMVAAACRQHRPLESCDALARS